MPFPPKPSKKKDDDDFERFAEMIRPIFLRMRLTDMLKMNPYAKYMKDIVTNKRNILEAEISTMLANYTLKGGIPKKLGDPRVPTIVGERCRKLKIFLRFHQDPSMSSSSNESWESDCIYIPLVDRVRKRSMERG